MNEKGRWQGKVTGRKVTAEVTTVNESEGKVTRRKMTGESDNSE